MTYLKAIGCILSISLLVACQSPDGATGKKDDKDKAPEPVPVEVAVAQRGKVDAIYTGTTSLEADGEASIKAKVSGEIVQLLVEEGDTVTTGQVVAKIDDERLKLELSRSRANLDKLQQDYQRNIELHQKGLLPAGTFEGMKYDLDGLEASYKLTQLELSYTTVRAPISGVVSARNIKLGNHVAVGESLFTITDLDPLIAYLHVPEKDFQKLSSKQTVHLLVDALPGDVFEGVIARISPVVDASTGTFKVTIEMLDNSGSLKPGMFGRVSIVYQSFDNAVMVPRSAIVDTDGGASVFVVEGATARKQDIQTGHFSGPNVQVVGGLAGGETIVVVGQNGLKDNGPIKIVNPLSDDAPLPSEATQTELAKSD